MLLTKLIDENIKTFGEYAFLYYKEKKVTNLKVREAGRSISRLLSSLEIKKGDRVLVCMPNCPEIIYSYQGILRTGAIVIPVLPVLHENEIHYILENSGAKAVITVSSTLPKIVKAKQNLTENLNVVCLDDSTTEQVTEGNEIVYFGLNGEDINSTENVKVELAESDVAVILYTSGTTGRPKGVTLTHQNFYANLMAGIEIGHDADRGATLGLLPLTHIFGFGVMNRCFYRGKSVVIIPKFNVEDVFQAIEKYKVKSFAAVPAMIHEMVNSPYSKKYDLSNLETVLCGSTTLPLHLRHAFREKFQAEVHDQYGLSEAPGVTSQRKGMAVKEGSVGIPMPGVKIKIMDENGKETPVGEVGELLIQGGNVTPGYFQNKEATREALKDGWLHTGDMAKVDKDGYLFIVDRKKDLIIRGGFNIYPRDLEELLLKHKAVSEVAVIGIPSERLGEEIIAFVVKNEAREVTEKELIEYCQKHLAKYKTPRQVHFLENLPRNNLGKIAKMTLKEIVS